MKINFRRELDVGLSGKYTHYHYEKANIDNWEYCDIRKFISLNQRNWLLEIEHWHAKLSEMAQDVTPFWWIIQGSRFHTWYPPIYNPLVFTIAVLEYCKAFNVDEITLLACPREVISYFKELKPNFQYSHSSDLEPKYLHNISQVGRLYNNLKHWGTLFLRSFRNIFCQNTSLLEKRLIIYSHIVEGDIDKNRPDHFFSTMLDEISTLNKREILWLYFSESESSETHIAFTDNLKKHEKDYIILQKMITPIESIRIGCLYLGLLLKYRKMQRMLPPFKVAGYESHAFPVDYFLLLVKNIFPIAELQVYFALKKILRKPSGIKRIYYPYEEKCLERAILMAIQQSSKAVVSMGYSHSIHNCLHMYFRTRPCPLGNPPRPVRFTVTGHAEKLWLIKEDGVAPEKVDVVGSSRYVPALSPPSDWESQDRKLRVLVLVGQPYELGILANYLNEVPDIFDNCKVVIRKYPFGWNEEQMKSISRIKTHMENVKVENEASMEAQIDWCDVAIFNSTSSGIIAMLSGRVSIFVDLHDMFYLDPTQNKGEDDAVIRCFSAEQLKEALQNLRNLTLDEYGDISGRQRNFALNIYAPPNRKQIFALLDDS